VERLHIGVVPDSVLDSEAKVIAWVNSKKDMRGLKPNEIVLTVTNSYEPDHATLKTVTVAEVLAGGRQKTVVTYHPMSKEG